MLHLGGKGVSSNNSSSGSSDILPLQCVAQQQGNHSWMLTTCALRLHQRQAPRVQGGSSSRGTALTLCTGQRLQQQQGHAPPLKGSNNYGAHASAQQQQQQQQQWRPPQLRRSTGAAVASPFNLSTVA